MPEASLAADPDHLPLLREGDYRSPRRVVGAEAGETIAVENSHFAVAVTEPDSIRVITEQGECVRRRQVGATAPPHPFIARDPKRSLASNGNPHGPLRVLCHRLDVEVGIGIRGTRGAEATRATPPAIRLQLPDRLAATDPDFTGAADVNGFDADIAQLFHFETRHALRPKVKDIAIESRRPHVVANSRRHDRRILVRRAVERLFQERGRTKLIEPATARDPDIAFDVFEYPGDERARKRCEVCP